MTHDSRACDSCRSAAPCPEREAFYRQPRAVVHLAGVDHSLTEAELWALLGRVSLALDEVGAANREGRAADGAPRADEASGHRPGRPEAAAAIQGHPSENGAVELGAIVLPGFRCVTCQGWTGTEKEALTHCRCCGAPRPA